MALLNTHKEVENLISVGVSKKMAEAIIDLHVKNQEELATKADIHSLKEATKKDLELFETKLEGKIDNLEAKLEGQITTKITELKADIASLRSDNKWSMNIIMVLLGGLITLLAPLGIQAIMQMIKAL